MVLTTRDEVEIYLMKETLKFSKVQLSRFTAQSIAIELSLSRSLVSFHLNELAGQAILVKINSRPVYFLHKKSVQDLFKLELNQTEFKKLEDFTRTLEMHSVNFSFLVGNQGTLRECIEQVKTALNYPKGGLPLWIEGEQGSGKTAFINAVEQYALAEKLVDSENIIRINASSGNFIDYLYQISTGKERNEKKSYIIIEHIDRIFEERENQLITWLSSRNDILLDNETPPQLIFVSLSNSESMVQLKRLIPMVVRLPQYQDYCSSEKSELISNFLICEEKRIQKEIYISKSAVSSLKSFVFTNHIDGLKTEIARMCAKTYREQEGSDKLRIHSIYFSAQILTQLDIQDECSDEFISSLDLVSIQSENWLGKEVDKVCALYLETQRSNQNMSDVHQLLQEYAKSANRRMFSPGSLTPSQVTIYSAIVENISLLLERRYQYSLPANLRLLLCGFIQLQVRDKIMVSHLQTLSSLKEEIFDHFKSDASVCFDFNRQVQVNLGLVLNDYFQLLILFNLQEINQKQSQIAKTHALIVCHGYATASSMAESVNTLIGQHVYDAVDMPLDSTVLQTIELLKLRIEKQKYIDKFLFLVDMGSLEKIDEGLKEIPNIVIGIINGVSTGMALDIGYQLLNYEEISTIVEKAKKSKYVQPRLIFNRKKEEAILFIGDGNASVPEHLKSLFLNSLPVSIPIKILTSHVEGNVSEMLETYRLEYDIKHVIGVLDRKLKEIDYLDITEMLELKVEHKIYQTLSQTLSLENMDILRRNLIKNYSLQSIVENMTILNPYILINEIEQFLNLVQQELHCSLDIRSRFGLYVHLAILVERLITRNQIECYKTIVAFEVEQEKFIKAVKKSFRTIESQYKIVLPISEIAYIYDFFETLQEKEI